MRTQIVLFQVLTVAGVMTVLGLASSARAVDIVDDPIQIDERAVQIVQTSNSLCWEMYRYHQQEPNYQQAYRTAKDLWRQAGALRQALLNGPVETESMVQMVSQMNDVFVRLDQELSKWGDGDRSSLAMIGGPTARTVVTDDVVVDLPLIGVQVGRPRVAVVEDGSPALQRRRLHPNSRGSKRSLERELASVKLAMSDLLEDAGVSSNPSPPAPGVTPASPVPQPPEAEKSALGEPVKVLPRSPK
jgi:hypothetical protein